MKILGAVAHSCNHSTQEAKAKDHEFKTSLSYLTRPCLKKSKIRFQILHLKMYY
ncbi:hypothetical protein I79_003795 [Cricetulus griseus]|uniref:Uncharacterized protein n=1 Tax=Cricetulus griseus TaxID=10029 RepID=G3H0X5_CRIGR|nr:hypothetical protein I79_003795 [Cricetulus griseus]